LPKNFHCSLAIAIKPEAKYRFYVATMVFYIVQKNHLNKSYVLTVYLLPT